MFSSAPKPTQNSQAPQARVFDQQAVNTAIEKVAKAISAERTKETGQAIQLYEQAIMVFNEQKEFANPEMRLTLDMYQALYTDKVASLNQVQADTLRKEDDGFDVIQQQELQGLIQEDNYDFYEKGLNFESMTVDYECTMIPDEQPLRPFFYMRLIQKTFTEGAFLTEHLFVPSAVWMQEKSQVYDVDKKLAMVESLKREMQTLGILKKNNAMNKNYKQVDTLLNFVLKMQAEIQLTLTQQDERADSARMSQVSSGMPYDQVPLMHHRSISIQQSRQESSVVGGAAGHQQKIGEADWGHSDVSQSVLGRISSSFQILGQKLKTNFQETLGLYGRPVADYAKAIQDLFNESYFLEQWLRELIMAAKLRTAEEETLLTKLSRISKFFQEQILGLVMNDIFSLLETYYAEQTQVMLEPQRSKQNSMEVSR